MDIVPEDTHRLLAYVEAVRSRGHRLTAKEFNEFAERPHRRQKKSSISILTSGIASALADQVTWTEPASMWFERLGWVTLESQSNASEISLTSLGSALLRHLSAPPAVQIEDSAVEVFLDPEDPMSYVRLIGTLSSLGDDVFLIDPYFRFEQLIDISGSAVKRVLTSHKIKKSAIAQLELTLGALPAVDRPEIRLVSDLHDRFAISGDGRVIALGSSIGSSRKNVGAIVEFHLEAGDAIRIAHEKLWSDAEAVKPRSGDADLVDEGGPAAESEHSTS